MDDALFLNNVIQNVFVELPKLAGTASERSAAYKNPQYSSPSFLKELSRAIKTLWISPLQWECRIKALREASNLVIENWDEIPESTRAHLVEASEGILNSSSKCRVRKKQGDVGFVRNQALLFSLHWASFVLKKNVVEELWDALDEFARDVFDRVDRIPGWNTSRTITLSNEARDAFLRDIENPPDPPEALVLGMRDFWEQYNK